MKLSVDGVANGAPISPKFAFGNIPAEGHFELSGNINPRRLIYLRSQKVPTALA